MVMVIVLGVLVVARRRVRPMTVAAATTRSDVLISTLRATSMVLRCMMMMMRLLISRMLRRLW